MPYLINQMTGKTHDTGAFAAGLLNPKVATPDALNGASQGKADKRYNVYRNNVTVSLINSVADIFPAVQKIVGEENFRLLAREYVRAHPPSSPLLFLYGQDFAAFIEGFEPAKQIPYLADIARIERSWLTAYHAADLAPLDPAKLSAVEPERLGDVRFKMHPATGIIPSQYPIQDLFLLNRGFSETTEIDLQSAQSVMLTRPETDTRIILLEVAETVFFLGLQAGNTLGEAAASATQADPSFDLNQTLQMLFGTGATQSIFLDDKEI